jgi:hypothetical protein
MLPAVEEVLDQVYKLQSVAYLENYQPVRNVSLRFLHCLSTETFASHFVAVSVTLIIGR